jgi:transketolase
VEEARSRSNLVLVVGDLGYGVVEPFADEFPDRFINVGVSEQNMVGLAAGLASEGMHVFTYSIANFPTFRCAEQLRNDVAYHNLPVTTVSVGGGLGYGALGYSHHAVQDYSLMRCMPNMIIAAPADPAEVASCLRAIINNPGPSYLRLGKVGESNCRPETLPEVKDGDWVPIFKSPGNKKVILVTGTAAQVVKDWRYLGEQLRDLDIYTVPLWSMGGKIHHAKKLAQYSSVITLEDHLVDGGFGSYISEVVHSHGFMVDLKILGLDPRVCGEVGSQDTLMTFGGVSERALIELVST